MHARVIRHTHFALDGSTPQEAPPSITVDDLFTRDITLDEAAELIRALITAHDYALEQSEGRGVAR